MGTDWQLRPLTDADIDAVAEIFGRAERKYIGTVETYADRIRQWLGALATFDPQRDQVGATIDGELVGAAFVFDRAAPVAVDPAFEGRGIGTALLDWAMERQRELGRAELRTNVLAGNTRAAELLTANGYAIERFYALMRREFAETGPPQDPGAPHGFCLRPLHPVADREVVHALDERAFRGRPDYTPHTLDEFDAMLFGATEFEPLFSFLAVAQDGEPAGFLIGWRAEERRAGFVQVLAVDPAYQRRGLGRALLLRAFTAMDLAGWPAAMLAVASDNPRALDLYTSLGMREMHRFDDYARPA